MAQLSDTESPNDAATPNDTLALPGDALREGVVTALRDALGEALLDSLIKPNDDVWVRVTAEA